jgi:hypothetical protein
MTPKTGLQFCVPGPFSQLGNPHALGVSVLRPSESGGGARKICPFLEANRLIPGGGPRKTRLKFCVPASVFSAGKPSRPRRECFAALGNIGGARKATVCPVLEANRLI